MLLTFIFENTARGLEQKFLAEVGVYNTAPQVPEV